MEVGDGTVRVGDDVFAGDGCARAGDVVAGDCDGNSETPQGDEPTDTSREKAGQETSNSDGQKPSNDNSGGTTIQKGITAPETPGGGTTVQNTTGVGRTEGRATSLFGETTQAGTTSEEIASCPTAPPEDAETAKVGRAVDGDTVELKEPVDGYDKVRLIGVNTPEMEGEDGSPEPGAKEASEFTADALEGQEVVLETDQEIEDPYGRLLAYVWLMPETGDPEFFNSTLIADGYAETMTVEPNNAYAECLAATEKEAGGDNPGSEEGRQGEDDDGLMGRLRDLLSSEPADDGSRTDGSTASEDQYGQNGSSNGPGSTDLEETSVTEPPEDLVGEQYREEPSKTTDEEDDTTPETTAGLTGSTTETEELAAVPPEACPGAEVVLEPFEGDGDAQSDSFEVTGGAFVVRADLKSEKPADARLDVSILDTEAQEPVEEFDQRTLGSYDTVISQGPGSYLLDLQPKAGSYEVAVFDCADKKPEQGSEEDPGAPLDLGSSAPPATPPATPPASEADKGPDQPADQPADIEVAAGDEPPAPADETESPVDDLPTQDTPSGEVAMLPDTGGPTLGAAPSVVLLTGTLAIAAGVAGLAAAVGLGRSSGNRSGTDGR
ncbi:MAG: thermonuclease family protein [Rubrobacteraceae bacterium]